MQLVALTQVPPGSRPFGLKSGGLYKFPDFPLADSRPVSGDWARALGRRAYSFEICKMAVS